MITIAAIGSTSSNQSTILWLIQGIVIINRLYKSVCDIIVTTLYIERAKVYDVSYILIILHVIHLCPTYFGRFINKLRNISKPLQNYQNNLTHFK